MEANAIRLYTLNEKSIKAYLLATLFIAGNILLPQLCHLVNLGGKIMLPINFFTLVGAYKYGWKVGLLTAIVSPLLNSAFFGMPPVIALPAIITKSVLLALAAGFIAHRFQKVSVLLLAVVVLAYQTVGTMFEWAYLGDFELAISDFSIGIPGMLLQVLGGFLVIRYLIRD